MIIKKRKDLVEEKVKRDPGEYRGVRYYPALTARKDDAPNFSMRLYEIDAGGNTSRHKHSYEHEVYVIEGDGILVSEDKEVKMEKGDFILIPQFEYHQIKPGNNGISFICVVPNYRKNFPD